MRDPAFTGSGHLSELSLDRLHLDAPESDPDFFARANAHVAVCGSCQAALAARATADAAFGMAGSTTPSGPPRITPRPTATVRALESGRWFTPLTVLAAAAAIVLVARPWHVPSDVIRAKGGSLSLRLQAHDGTARRAVVDGDRVHPGERVAFVVEVDRRGHLMVVGWDDTGVLYPAHPGAPGAAPAVAPGPRPIALDTAIQLDDRLGHERFAAIFCAHTFDFATLDATMNAERGVDQLRAQLPGCVVRATSLVKVAR